MKHWKFSLSLRNRLQELDRARVAMERPRALILGVAFVLLLLLLWVALAQISMVVRAEGRVIPSDKSQVIQHLEGGVLMSMLVNEGGYVKSGQVLAKISDVRGTSQLGERQVRVDSLLARIARLQAEADGAREVKLPPGKTIDAAVLQSEIASFSARRQKLDQELRTAREQITQRQAEQAEQKSKRANLLAEAEVAQKQADISAALFAKGSASRLEALDSQAKLQRFRTLISETESAIPRLQAAMAEAQNRTLEIESKFRAEVRADLASTKTELSRLEQEVMAETDRVDRSEIRAPVGGIVNRVYINTVGGVIRPGEAVMEITPMDSKIVVEARVRPVDRAELHVGLPVQVRLSAYDYSSYGTGSGQITEVSADTVADERGERYYRVRVELDPSKQPFAGRPILPGMTATAEIVVGRRSVLAYLLSPLSRFSRNAMSEPR
jgi:membrane fusion protein, adhesin transport system